VLQTDGDLLCYWLLPQEALLLQLLLHASVKLLGDATAAASATATVVSVVPQLPACNVCHTANTVTRKCFKRQTSLATTASAALTQLRSALQVTFSRERELGANKRLASARLEFGLR
jgi:hypothetical protein